jgi:hypothetical protein
MGMYSLTERSQPEDVTETVVKRKGKPERSVEQRDGRRNTNKQRGWMRATSVLGNAKSKGHRKTHQVELGGMSRKYMHLTRGELCRESGREVSRGRSSEEAW